MIEGYPRSANTYAVAAMLVANPGLRICSHLHTWRAIRMGRALDIPTLVLIRNPLDAAASLMAYRPGVSAKLALHHYVNFYDHLYSLSGELVVADFTRVVGSFGEVIVELNKKFRTSYAPYNNNPANEASARHIVDEAERTRGGGVLEESKVSRPSASRAAILDANREEVRRARRALSRANRVYAYWSA